jgi:hypothetical protein
MSDQLQPGDIWRHASMGMLYVTSMAAKALLTP